MQFVERAAWVPSLGIEYHLGVDGLGLLMVLLSALVVPFALLASWNIQENPKLYFSLALLLESGLIGTFTAQNFIHWFVFWELSLIPAFFLIKIWGGPRRTSAAYQFFIYTMAGSVAMLAGFLALYAATGVFDFGQLADLARGGRFAGGPSQALARIVFARRLSGLGGEGAAGALPYLAAGGLHGGADRDGDVIDRGDVENGRLRIPAHAAADLSRCKCAPWKRRCCGWPRPRSSSRRRPRWRRRT